MSRILLQSMICSFLMISSIKSTGQSNYGKFKALFKKNDSVKLNILLNEWKSTGKNDPELYTSCINYYFKKSKQEIVSLGRKPNGNPGLTFTDSTGLVAGYVNFSPDYNSSFLDSAFLYANQGIVLFPSRLDIRFGKIFMLGEINDYDHFTKEVIQVLEYSQTIRNEWLWTENKRPDRPENFMLSTVQAYLQQMYETEDDRLLENMKKIGEKALTYYPNDIEILSTTAVANLLTGNYDKAIGYLKRAEKIDPKDFIVLNNIAKAYDMKGDKAESVHYYELTEKYGDEEAKSHARKEINKIKSGQNQLRPPAQ
jgi:tetratricopeptide (TPR) repeat protein